MRRLGVNLEQLVLIVSISVDTQAMEKDANYTAIVPKNIVITLVDVLKIAELDILVLIVPYPVATQAMERIVRQNVIVKNSIVITLMGVSLSAFGRVHRVTQERNVNKTALIRLMVSIVSQYVTVWKNGVIMLLVVKLQTKNPVQSLALCHQKGREISEGRWCRHPGAEGTKSLAILPGCKGLERKGTIIPPPHHAEPETAGSDASPDSDLGEFAPPIIDADSSTSAGGAEASIRPQPVPPSQLYKLGKTPIKLDKIFFHTQNYSDHQFLREGFQHGFKLQYFGPRSPRFSKNLTSLDKQYPVAEQKIYKEVSLGRVAGPFKEPPFPTLQVSPLGLVPKKDGDYRLIHHLLYPESASINDFIDTEQSSVTYSTIDDAAAIIAKLGRGAFLAKSDIKSAFRLLPVNSTDFDLLGYHFNDGFYYDKILPFGCKISFAIWDRFAGFLHWLIQDCSKNASILHYLDDFLFCGKELSICKNTLDTFLYLCNDLGVPIANEKTVYPTQVLTFLGIEFNTVEMIMRLPLVKIDEIKQKILDIMALKKVTLKQLQSLLGLLNFACRVIVPGRAFCRRLIDATIGLNKPHHHTRVTLEMKADLKVWLDFLQSFNGISVITEGIWVNNETLQLYTDSAGGRYGGLWYIFCRPISWFVQGITRDMTFLELFPVHVAIELWKHQFSNNRILFYIDNMAVVHVINSTTSKSERVMKIWGKFRRLAPAADPWPTPLPKNMWEI
ncbi:uncharacterized protein LOC133204281 [Saccostrea echinata]|uniref:uncharacterized protein LOC133204281 n=1 Tax=Saccostrea echinata TaxID=191078 RepID=UPI002A809998|nr:uncharacterized protein LOC133204281 [Saccostrea echinata]